MSDQPQAQTVSRTTTPPAGEVEEGGGLPIQRYLLIGLGGFAVLIVIGLLVALIGGVINSDGVANFFRILRDFFIIVLALLGILMCAALMILVVQISSLVNMLRREVKPIIDETRETLATVRGTTTFISQNVTQPVIRATALMAGTRTLLGDIMSVRRNLRPRQ